VTTNTSPTRTREPDQRSRGDSTFQTTTIITGAAACRPRAGRPQGAQTCTAAVAQPGRGPRRPQRQRRSYEKLTARPFHPLSMHSGRARPRWCVTRCAGCPRLGGLLMPCILSRLCLSTRVSAWSAVPRASPALGGSWASLRCETSWTSDPAACALQVHRTRLAESHAPAAGAAGGGDNGIAAPGRCGSA
jgi:hypothetical protein